MKCEKTKKMYQLKRKVKNPREKCVNTKQNVRKQKLKKNV